MPLDWNIFFDEIFSYIIIQNLKGKAADTYCEMLTKAICILRGFCILSRIWYQVCEHGFVLLKFSFCLKLIYIYIYMDNFDVLILKTSF
jgi:hypothetical protein